MTQESFHKLVEYDHPVECPLEFNSKKILPTFDKLNEMEYA